MDRKEMLKRMGLSEPELKDLLAHFRHFYSHLNERQKKVVRRSLPSLEQAAKTFGPGVSPDQMQELFDADSGGGTFNSEIAGNQVNPTDNDQ
jgi:hypothetical protein